MEPSTFFLDSIYPSADLPFRLIACVIAVIGRVREGVLLNDVFCNSNYSD